MKPIFTLGVGAVSFWSGFVYRSQAEQTLLLAVVIAIVADWLTGIAAAWKEGKAITSSRMRQGVTKIIGYLALILITIATTQALIASGLSVPAAPITALAIGLIFATEALSVLENITKLTGLKTEWLRRLLRGMTESQDQEEPTK